MLVAIGLQQGIYAWLIPSYFPGFKSSLPLVATVTASTTFCFCVTFRTYPTSTMAFKVSIGVVSALVCIYLCLFVLVNTMGS